MFKRNDYALKVARILLIISVILGSILSFVLGIVYAVKYEWWHIYIIPSGWLSCFIIWIFGRLILSFFCDVKLIRNKLYDEDNFNLEEFFEGKNSQYGVGKSYNLNSENDTFRNLVDAGVITEEEYKEMNEDLDKW